MSALKWHLCDRLWEIKPPMRMVPAPATNADDEEDQTNDEQAATAEDDERPERIRDPKRMLRIVAM